MNNIKLETIKESGIVAILRGIEGEKVLNIAEALLKGGIQCIEVTFNTPFADKMIENIKKTFGGTVLVGAGTVTSEETARIAYESGAEFILSPSLHKDVIDFSKAKGMISIPGAFTPTEIITAKKWGADIVKIFPAAAVAPSYIKLLSGPLDDIDMMAVGGIDLDNIGEYLKNGCVCAGVGSSLTNAKGIDNQEYLLITKQARAFTDRIKETRKAFKT
ncbi:2-dehydro-3-deoxyphosphogluconate aldolase / (4S)-4-hydroxy-2-oxoglutarate aldolase [Geosporobacter subterraneus DSM 17957]|uniref:2-dehydro-3-deoxyphosphogluconate aldolase / (4S)-4-hydroxy-2-oxoglutarate aldolase n=1 Tax=Geosporobacter subterraneus DSM 17957 TaxID=1121919 RepID=A0A1M6EQJ2_9FIRM|nr:bifunctional 4-hydroxy-2-oxoglutarate aldolase/2-dehydro-3-deoxy-phosphogluconate aldolase [Geosporobacter subterraneus]SHI87751.1 2-dehydro-3-deoxyphosphogluconate aldolase / (4S)-4-hydroxy-2-oxoglutarate aldolase [Geosporobacter subterraneus DSM 17957]